MKILLSIIALHLLVLLAGRTYKEIDIRSAAILAFLVLLLVSAVLYGMFTMENPEIKI